MHPAPYEALIFFNSTPLLFSSHALEMKVAPAPCIKTLLVQPHHGTPQQEDETTGKPTDGEGSGAGLACDQFSEPAEFVLAPSGLGSPRAS